MAQNSTRGRVPPPRRGQPQRPPAATSPTDDPPFAWKIWAAALALLLVVSYLPVLRGGFLYWDDQDYVEHNETLRSTEGLARIWNPAARATPQFYPPVFTSYWLEYHLWGTDARGYHAVNVALHLANVLLLLLLIRRMGASRRTAFLCAAIFALHPTQVASVAWISERKNTLAMLFYLAAFLAYLRHRRTGGWGAYGAFIASGALALLSKSQTATLPASLFVADWAMQRAGKLPRLNLAAVAARMVPLLGLGVVLTQITIRFETRTWTPTFTPLDRFLLASNALWFYIRTFLAPVRLSPIYPLWEIHAEDWTWWVAPSALSALALLLVAMRRRIPPLAAWGIAQFFLGALPVIGIFSFNLLMFTPVADHFLYWSCIGGSLVIALAFDAILNRVAISPARRRWAWPAAAALVLAVGTTATYAETVHWRTNDLFWLRVQARDPNGFLGNLHVGNNYRRNGEFAMALPYYRRAAQAQPEADFPFRHYIDALRHTDGAEAAVQACTGKIASDPDFYAAYLERGISYQELGRYREAYDDLQQTLRLTQRGSRPWAETWRHLEQVQYHLSGR